jgi:hypothetical protein
VNFEELQSAWQSQGAPSLTLKADLVLKEVEHNRRHFLRTIFWRDVREVGTAVVLAPVFFYWAITFRDWMTCLPGLACLGVAIFMLVDRWLQRKKQAAKSDPLRTCIESSLAQVNHQIWLLKNVLWWYLLPIGLSLEIVFVCSAWRFRALGLWRGVLPSIGMALGCLLLYWGIYWINQLAVRKSLEPRRKELESLLASLDE